MNTGPLFISLDICRLYREYLHILIACFLSRRLADLNAQCLIEHIVGKWRAACIVDMLGCSILRSFSVALEIGFFPLGKPLIIVLSILTAEKPRLCNGYHRLSLGSWIFYLAKVHGELTDRADRQIYISCRLYSL